MTKFIFIAKEQILLCLKGYLNQPQSGTPFSIPSKLLTFVNRIRESTNYVLKAFGNEGLRTLVYATKKFDNDAYNSWVTRYAVLFSTFHPVYLCKGSNDFNGRS